MKARLANASLAALNAGLAEVLAKLQTGGKEAHTALKELISDSEQGLLRIKSHLNQLTIGSFQLRAI